MRKFILFLISMAPFLTYSQSIKLILYVSEQEDNVPLEITSGERFVSASEGRVINIKVTTKGTGNVTFSPSSFSLTGPPCPDYDSEGNRIPAEVQPPDTATAKGKITLVKIPASGTSDTSGCTVKDDGYWEVCSDETKKYFSQSGSVEVIVHSIGAKINAPEKFICGTITAKGKGYPDGGTYQWSTSSEDVTLNNTASQDVEVKLTSGKTSGNVELELKYTYAGKSYTAKKTIKIDYDSSHFILPVRSAGAISRNNLAAGILDVYLSGCNFVYYPLFPFSTLVYNHMLSDINASGEIAISDPSVKDQMELIYKNTLLDYSKKVSGSYTEDKTESITFNTAILGDGSFLGYALGTSTLKLKMTITVSCESPSKKVITIKSKNTLKDEIDWNSLNELIRSGQFKGFYSTIHGGAESLFDILFDKVFDCEYNIEMPFEDEATRELIIIEEE